MKCKCGHDKSSHPDGWRGCIETDANGGLCDCRKFEHVTTKPKPRRKPKPFTRWRWDRENDKELGPDRIDYDGRLFIRVEQHDVDQTKNVIALVRALNAARVVLPKKARR